MITYESCGSNSDFNAVTGYIRNQYTSRASDDDRYNYSNLKEEKEQKPREEKPKKEKKPKCFRQ